MAHRIQRRRVTHATCHPRQGATQQRQLCYLQRIHRNPTNPTDKGKYAVKHHRMPSLRIQSAFIGEDLQTQGTFTIHRPALSSYKATMITCGLSQTRMLMTVLKCKVNIHDPSQPIQYVPVAGVQLKEKIGQCVISGHRLLPPNLESRGMDRHGAMLNSHSRITRTTRGVVPQTAVNRSVHGVSLRTTIDHNAHGDQVLQAIMIVLVLNGVIGPVTVSGIDLSGSLRNRCN